MIFCTVGTTSFPFHRLLTPMTALKRKLNETIIIQDVDHPLSYTQMMRYMKNARAIVCHGGAGTILMAISYASAQPLVIPRLHRFGEHIDDHQRYFTRYMKKRGLILSVENHRNITQTIRAYLAHPPKQKRTTSPTKQQLINQLHQITAGLR
jgi:UDP-N-acetylglucosamine transferase subunit ALG13